MRLTKDGKIGGVPVMRVRDALRRYGGPDRIFTNEAIAGKCGVSSDVAARVVSALKREGYIKPAKHGDGPGWWETTSKGNALRLASTRTLRRNWQKTLEQQDTQQRLAANVYRQVALGELDEHSAKK